MMALNRKKRYGIPVKCSICKKQKAFHTIHGFRLYGGQTCCDDCFPKIKEEWEKEQKKEASYDLTEADYQTWYRL